MNKKIGIVAALCLCWAALWVSACGGSSGCTLTVAGFTECYTSNEPDFSTACTAAGGKSGACSTTNSVGTCATTVASYTNTYTFYSTGGQTATTAQASCKALMGTFTAAN